jgi:transposase-like protein
MPYSIFFIFLLNGFIRASILIEEIAYVFVLVNLKLVCTKCPLYKISHHY